MAPDDPDALDDATLLEEDVEELYEHAPVGYLSSLPGGLIVKVNRTLLSWTGHDRDGLVGLKRFQDLLAPGARIYYETHYAPLLQMQGHVREIAVELLRADGSRIPVLLNSTLVRDAVGRPRVVRTTVFDASDRRRYERELLQARVEAETRARAALALAHVGDGVLLVTPDGKLDVVNHAAEAILDLTAADALGRPVREAIAGWDTLAGRVPVGRPGDATDPATLPLTRGAHEQWLAVVAVESGEGVVYTIRDVTAEHRLEELRSDLVAVVSHELRTPLTGASGAAQTLLARYDALDDAMRRQLLQLIVEQGERMSRILDQILMTRNLDAGEVTLEETAFEARDAFAAVVDSLPASERERVAVECATSLLARGDAATASQILAGLVENALKYSAGPVRVAAALEEQVVRFTVADEGPGIPVSERERIFEKFHRLDPAQRGGVGGTGLGLYIARELARRMHGRMGVLPSDEGTTIFLDLPAAG